MKLGDFVWLAVVAAVTSLLFVPDFQQRFAFFTEQHAYLMGFAKFALLATLGELAAVRIANNAWTKPAALLARMVIWGVTGMVIVLIFELFQHGVSGAAEKGFLWTGDGAAKSVWVAFYIAVTMNLTFAPVFMVVHRILDLYLELVPGSTRSWPRVSWADLLSRVSWQTHIPFIAKTVLLFWIPAHTVTFLLPSEYRVIVAAYLSIALGALLAYGKKRCC